MFGRLGFSELTFSNVWESSGDLRLCFYIFGFPGRSELMFSYVWESWTLRAYVFKYLCALYIMSVRFHMSGCLGRSELTFSNVLGASGALAGRLCREIHCSH